MQLGQVSTQGIVNAQGTVLRFLLLKKKERRGYSQSQALLSVKSETSPMSPHCHYVDVMRPTDHCGRATVYKEHEWVGEVHTKTECRALCKVHGTSVLFQFLYVELTEHDTKLKLACFRVTFSHFKVITNSHLHCITRSFLHSFSYCICTQPHHNSEEELSPPGTLLGCRKQRRNIIPACSFVVPLKRLSTGLFVFLWLRNHGTHRMVHIPLQSTESKPALLKSLPYSH